MSDWMQSFGLTSADLDEALGVQGHGSGGLGRTVTEAQADVLDALRGKPLGEILAAQGKLAPERQAEFEEAWKARQPTDVRAGGDTPAVEPGTEGSAARPVRFPTCVPEEVTARDVPATGGQVARFRLLERIGSGGMGVVWKAHDPQLDRVVAL